MKSLIPEFVRQLRCMTLLFVMALTVGCSTDEHTAQLIARAERIAKEYPDSAHTIMRSVDPETIYGDRDMAHYRLVYSEALYYSKIDSDNDSLTRPMAEYYRYDDNHTERARAMYQHALVMFNGGKNAESMYYLLEAEKSLEHISNPRLAGLVHNLKGEIYGLECLFANSLEEYEKSAECYDETDLQYHKTDVIEDIGTIYKHLQEYDKAEHYLTQAVQLCIDHSYLQLLPYPLWSLAQIYIDTNRFDKCEDIIQCYHKYDCEFDDEQKYYYLSAILAANSKNHDDALEYLRIARNFPRNPYVEDLYFIHLVYKLIGDNEQALHYYTLSKKEQDELFLNVISVPILNAQLDALNSKIESEVQQSENSRLRYIIAIVSILFTLLSFIGYLRYRNMRQKRNIAEYISVISELQQSIKDISATPHREHSSSEDFTELNKLCEVLYTYGDTSDVTRRIALSVTKSINLLKNDQKRIQDLERMVNQRYDNILVTLQERCPKLNAKDLRYILYHLLGFSPHSICVLLDVDAPFLSRLKYRIKNKFVEAQCEDLFQLIFDKKILNS